MNRDIIGDGKIQNMDEPDFRTKPGVGQVGKAEDAGDGELPLLHPLSHHLVKIPALPISVFVYIRRRLLSRSFLLCIVVDWGPVE